MEEFLWCKLFWRRKTKHDLQMLSRKCFFPKATGRTEHISVCEDWWLCLAVNEGAVVKSVPGALSVFSTQTFHRDALMTPARSPWNPPVPRELNQIFQETKFLTFCLPSYVDRITWISANSLARLSEELPVHEWPTIELYKVLEGNVQIMKNASFSLQALSE